MDYSLAEIRAFNATVVCGNFSRAAEKLGVSQPAITAQIRKLENRFEYPLLERFSKGIVPTELGRRLYRITSQFQDLEGAIELLANPQHISGEISLRLAVASPLVFMPLIADFRQHYPQVRLKIASHSSLKCQEMVMNREADIALCPLLDKPKGALRLAFHAHRLVAVLPAGHPLCRESEVSLVQLNRESLIFSRSHSLTQFVIDEGFSQANLEPCSHILMDNRQEICEAVSFGLGIGFAFENDIRPESRIELRPIRELSDEVVEHVCWLKNRSTLPGIRDFIQLALQQRCMALPAEEQLDIA
ncbi:LysR family transcriptional regulator [Neptuniibacter halophilus]|uniref:LysR family transcriptional regulator n=1 Tax=Neptuniibacter halophilus TaxID=651666 RepID=UPI0025742F9A|nr:LysR family transcriptional regulator [Neptuniibacter halophilus]